MLQQQNVENIDQLLNELEVEAHLSTTSAKFFAHLLHRVRLLLEAEGVAILLPTAGSWVTIAASGHMDSQVPVEFCGAAL